jgi:hypothetical protein
MTAEEKKISIPMTHEPRQMKTVTVRVTEDILRKPKTRAERLMELRAILKKQRGPKELAIIYIDHLLTKTRGRPGRVCFLVSKLPGLIADLEYEGRE